MKINRFFATSVFLLAVLNGIAQTWPKLYGEPNSYELSFDVEDAYDGGYYILGNITNNLVYEKSWLIKTDVNGEILWEKIFSDSGHNLCLAMEPTLEGGVLLCGWVRHEGEENSNPSVIKLDACGEKLWCRMFSENIGDAVSKWANDVKETPSGDIVVLVNEYGYHPINTMHLFKLNADGEVLWRNPYASANQHPGSINPRGNNLLITSKGEYLIAGQCYWEDPWNPGGLKGIRPTFSLVDSVGNEIWVLPFGVQDTLYGSSVSVIESDNNEFHAIGSYWPEQYVEPLFMKFDTNGIQLDYDILYSNEIASNALGGSFSSLLHSDSIRFGGGLFAFSTDNYLTILESVIYYDPPSFTFISLLSKIYNNNGDPYESNLESPNKFVSLSNKNGDLFLAKLNLNLEYDTLDPGNYTYDSLCTTPGLPQSGFISLDDCDLFTDIDKIPTAKQYQEKIRWIPIKAYPNPVTEGKLTLEFENTKHHKNMELHCYDDFGRQIHSQKIYKGQQDADMDVSGWPPGIYIAVVYSDGSARGKVKFVVR